MEKRIFAIREDKYKTCSAICQHIEKHGASSKSELKHGLDRPYSRISESVDWLSTSEVGILKGVKSLPTKPGKPEIMYRIRDPSWRQKIRPIHVNRKLEKMMMETQKLQKIIESQDRVLTHMLRELGIKEGERVPLTGIRNIVKKRLQDAENTAMMWGMVM